MTTMTTTVEKTGKNEMRDALPQEEESQKLEIYKSAANESENLVKGVDWENIGLILMTDTARSVSSPQRYKANVGGEVGPEALVVSYAPLV